MRTLLSVLTLLCVHIAADEAPGKGLIICCNGTAKSRTRFAYSMTQKPRQESIVSLWPEPKNIVQSALPNGPSSSWSFFSNLGNVKDSPYLAFDPQVCLQTSHFSQHVKSFFLHFCNHVPFYGKDTGARLITEIHVSVALSSMGQDASLRLGHDESYDIQFRAPITHISSKEIWGLRHALETLIQLEDNDTPKNHEMNISDAPAFPWRGLLLDTSRHFFSEQDIMRQLEAMSMSKLNVLHWHLTDAQSFPLLLKSHPRLAKLGAHGPGMWYDKAAVDRIVSFAEALGIRIVPEIDIPSHTWSWRHKSGDQHQSLVLDCSHLASPKEADRFKRQDKSTLDPTNPDVYKLIEDILDEIVGMFPDEYVHVGGDETDLRCFTSVMVKARRELGINSPRELLQYFWNKIVSMISQRGKVPILWGGSFAQGIRLPKESGAIFQTWRNWGNPVLGLITARRAARAGFNVLQSTHYYLDWDMRYSDFYEKEYFLDPEGTLGGEACSWSEHVDALNVDCRIWPRASVMAERLWTGKKYSPELAEMRRNAYENHRHRMVSRGIVAASNGRVNMEYCGKIEQALQRSWSQTKRHHLKAYHLLVAAPTPTSIENAFSWVGRKTDAALIMVLIPKNYISGQSKQDLFLQNFGKKVGLPYTRVCIDSTIEQATLLTAGRSDVTCHITNGALLVQGAGITSRIDRRTGLLLSALPPSFAQSGSLHSFWDSE